MAKKRIDIEVRQKGAQRAEKEMHKLGGAVQSSILKYASLGIGITTVTSFLKKSIEAYGVQELAEKKLQTALGGTSKVLLDYASALQRASNYGDEQIINVMGLIGAFVKDEKSIKLATQATLDFAAATGMDLNAAGQLVAKTLGSTTDALTRYGMKTVGAVGSTERLKSMTEGIAKLWGGQAKAASETFTGEINQMSMAWGDLQETFGGMIASFHKAIPVMTVLADGFRLIGEYINKFNNIEPMGIAAYIGLKASEQIFKDAEAIKEVVNATEGLSEAEKYHQSIIERLREQEEAYQTWKASTLEQIKTQKELAEYQARFLEEDQKLQEMKSRSVELQKEHNVLLFDYSEELGQVIKEEKKLATSTKKTAKELEETWRPMAESFVAPISGAFQKMLTDGQMTFNELGEAFKRMLINMVSELMARSAIFAFLNIISGGTINLGSSFITGGLTGFQHGGKFIVPGSGGIDSSLVAFKATPGEAVTVTPPGMSTSNIININVMGNVISNRRWIRDELLPEIYTAVNRGY